jgi:glutathione synthase/RimK-type ligase-like ATP-grasp enzyme
MKDKILVIIYNGDDWDIDIPLADSLETRVSFEDFYTYAKTRGISVYRASITWFDEMDGVFSKVWMFSDGSWKKIKHPIKPDAVFDKVSGKYDYDLFALKTRMTQSFPVVNSPLFRTNFDNKLSQYLAFPEFMPVTRLAENQQDFQEAVAMTRTGKVVLKEAYGSGGKQVVIGEKKTIGREHLSFPILVQEFVPTSGIPGFSVPGSIADLRLVYIGKELIYALSRIAKQGSLFTNFHQGANAVLVPKDRIPDSCLTVAEKIRKKLSLFQNANYSLDFMFATDGTPIFIEMNTTPGLDLLRIVGTPEIKEHYYKELLASFFTNTL